MQWLKEDVLASEKESDSDAVEIKITWSGKTKMSKKCR